MKLLPHTQSASEPHELFVVVMGVAGCGKSTVANAIADALQPPGSALFLDADSFHTPSNIDKMRNGTPLTDEDRLPWLEKLASAATAAAQTKSGSTLPRTIVMACSALRKRYRDVLRNGVSSALQPLFVYLDCPQSLAEARAASRSGHFMLTNMVASQFAILEPPTAEQDVVRLDASAQLPTLTAAAVAAVEAVRASLHTPPLITPSPDSDAPFESPTSA